VSALAARSRASRRLPVLVLVVAAVAAGVGAGGSHAPTVPRPAEPVDATQLPVTDAVSTAWFCPGVPASFPLTDQTFTLSNLGSSTARAAVTVHPDDGSAPVTHTVTVPRASVRSFGRATLPSGPLVIEPFSPDVVVSAGLESADQLSTVPCATNAGTDWYFAAGTTVRGVAQWLVLEDPFAADARVDIVLRTDAGLQELPSLSGLDVPGRSRVVIPIHDQAVRRDRVSVEVHAIVGQVVASQTIQYGAPTGTPGVATSIGAVKPASSWWFTGGDTRTGASEVIAVANIGQLDTQVNVQAQTAAKKIVRPVQVTVPSGGVSWVQVGGCTDASKPCLDVPQRIGYVLLVQSDSDAPIVAQTLSRFDGEGDTTLGVATSIGSAHASRHWVIARIGARGRRSTSVALSDPGLKAARVSVAIVRGGLIERPAELQRVRIAPGQRYVVPVGDPGAGGPLGGAVVITSDVPIFAESTIYADNDATRAPGIPER
jgi:hypothetical protein